jgi:hypothetical protein
VGAVNTFGGIREDHYIPPQRGVPSFYVSYRFLFFHHVAALPWVMENDALIMHAPFGKPGQATAICVGD